MDQIEFLKSNSLFKGFDEASILKFAEVFEELEYESGGIVFEENTPADALYIIMEGCVNIYIKNSEGKQIMIGRLIQNETLGLLSLIGNFEHLINAVAQENTTILKLPRQKFIELNKTNPQMSLRLILNAFSEFVKLLQENSETFKFIIETYISKKV
ncbi:MAG: cyclic nucleotide-binding domain-containing protein [Deltaproteobacteria bacterium]|nr:cyclic nucleotide-binding domain-containing protein [Deltaproteobacteria bacterium]